MSSARLLLLAAIGMMLPPLTVTAQPAGQINYTPPTDQIRLVERDRLTLSETNREQLATLLVTAAKTVVAEQRRTGGVLDSQLLAKCMALALDLAAEAKAVVVANFQFAKNVGAPPPDGAPTLPQIAAALTQLAESLSATRQEEDVKLGNYLFDLAAALDPLNEDAVFRMSTAATAGFKPAWKEKLAGAAAAEPAPATTVSAAPFAGRARSSIKILLVNTTRTGVEVGSTNNLIGLLLRGHEAPAPVLPPPAQPPERRVSKSGTAAAIELPPAPVDTGNLRVAFVLAGKVGAQMNTAAQEAARLVSVRHPELPPLRAQLSFEDKYTPKDGGSCGTAAAIVLLSLVEDFDLDPGGVITGDITVDGQVQKIGGVSAKTEGAIAAGAEFMVLPAHNTVDVDDYFVLHQLDDARKIQLFSAANLDEALTLTKREKTGELAQAMELFRALPATAANLKTPDARRQLQEIVRLAPNHLSAQILLRGVTGSLPKKLSVTGSIEQIFSAAGPLLYWMSNSAERGDEPPVYSREVGEQCTRRLNALNFKVDPKTASLQDAMLTYAQELQTAVGFGQVRDWSGIAAHNPRFRPVFNARARLYAEIRALQCDQSVLEKYLRKDSGSR
ncbi:MAG: hypothetical protein LBK76_05560 [Verrucomicrobiales bacterium]|jgi:hypothetical protein|nr:hypothetical protein [Verrucomicrobiales bacterium]